MRDVLCCLGPPFVLPPGAFAATSGVGAEASGTTTAEEQKKEEDVLLEMGLRFQEVLFAPDATMLVTESRFSDRKLRQWVLDPSHSDQYSALKRLGLLVYPYPMQLPATIASQLDGSGSPRAAAQVTGQFSITRP